MRNPNKIINQPSKGATKYIGKDATVVINSKGKIITTWPNNRAGRRIK
jgi:hypothetical protein